MGLTKDRRTLSPSRVEFGAWRPEHFDSNAVEKAQEIFERHYRGDRHLVGLFCPAHMVSYLLDPYLAPESLPNSDALKHVDDLVDVFYHGTMKHYANRRIEEFITCSAPVCSPLVEELCCQ
jgi:hypothetical protein